jgi:hypothetical protein
MENVEILERLRNYDFFRNIDYTNEYEDRLEKFLILASRTKKFQLENGKELNYEIIKKLLKKKKIEMKRDEDTYHKKGLQDYPRSNIDSIKWRILDDLNIIFKEENIKFCFTKNNLNYFQNSNSFEKSDSDLYEIIDNSNKKVPTTKRLEKYNLSISGENSGIYGEFKENLEKFLIAVAKTNLFILKETKEPISYYTVKYLLNKKSIIMETKLSEFNSKSLALVSKYIFNNLSKLKDKMLEDLNMIFKKQKIEFDFVINKDKYSNDDKIQSQITLLRNYNFFKVKTGLEEEYEDRLGRLLVVARNTKIIVFKTSKTDRIVYDLTYDDIKFLMRKKGLTFQMSEIKFNQSATLTKSIADNLDTMKYQILKDLNTIFAENGIIFELDESQKVTEISKEVPKKKQTISERLEKYKIPVSNTGVFEKYRETVEKFLIAVAKTHLFMLKKSKEPLTFPIIKFLLHKKTLTMKIDKFDFSLKKLSAISPYIYENLNEVKFDLLEDLNAIFDEEDIEFAFMEYINQDEFIKSIVNEEKENMKNTTKRFEEVKTNTITQVQKNNGMSKLEYFVEKLRKYHFKNIRQSLEKEYIDRLEKLLILSGKSNRVMIKNTKQLLDYEVMVSLLKRKGLKGQATKRIYNNGGFPESSAKKFENQKYDIIEDLNVIFKNEEIEFCLVDDLVDEDIYKDATTKITDNKSNETSKDNTNQKLLEEIALLKENMANIEEELKIYKETQINGNIGIRKINIEFPDFIKEIDNSDTISFRGNKEFYKKFKQFVIFNNISMSDFMNYLFHYAMEELGK